MTFTNDELRILNVAYETFVIKEYALRLFTEKNPVAGYESWVTNELQVAFWVRGIEAHKKQKPDMLIDGLEVEIKVYANPASAILFINDFEEHPDCDIHLCVTAFNEDSRERLTECFRAIGIESKERVLGNSGWIVIIAKPIEGNKPR